MTDHIPAALTGARTPAGSPLNDDHYRIGDRVTGTAGHADGYTGVVTAWEATYDHNGLNAEYCIAVESASDEHTLYGVDHDHLRPADPTVRIHHGPNRTLTVYVNGADVGSTNYETVGWVGLDTVDAIVTAVTAAADISVTHTDYAAGPADER